MLKVLVAEDQSVTQKLVENITRDLAKCDMADNGKMAYEKFKEALESKEPYDLVLLDVGLPVIDGIELLKGIRGYEAEAGVAEDQRVKIFMFTESIGRFTEAHEAGCDDYVLKPVDPENLLTKIKSKVL
jgi:CheY-like chemotaxis protein